MESTLDAAGNEEGLSAVAPPGPRHDGRSADGCPTAGDTWATRLVFA
ncbi:MAG: hypothetical protein ACLP9L_14795 [Thermoguttaceae bacterium]